MLNQFSIKIRMYLIIFLFFALFVFMIFFSVSASHNVRDLAISDASKVMLEDQKAKLSVATHTIALALGEIIKPLQTEDEKIDVIRKAIDGIRFEDDESGYYFVYQGTTNIALPPKKSLQGKDLGNFTAVRLKKIKTV